jgi:hypothetical protein
MVCRAWLLAVGGQVQDSRLYVQEEGCCTTPIKMLMTLTDYNLRI